jgi:hypothetical protein
MAEASVNAPSATAASFPQERAQTQTGWVGWVVFAGMMLVMVGIFHIIEGLVAVFRDEVYLVRPNGLLVNIDFTGWGWAHMIGGALLILVGACLLAGQMWARVVAVIVAGVSALINIAFLPAYPILSVLMVSIDILVIWAVTVHGSEIKQTS